VQQGVVVNPGDPLAEAFMAFLFSERAGRLIRAAGYALPGGTDALAR
jgi:molybdate transport system substrate-binding protein